MPETIKIRATWFTIGASVVVGIAGWAWNGLEGRVSALEIENQKSEQTIVEIQTDVRWIRQAIDEARG